MAEFASQLQLQQALDASRRTAAPYAKGADIAQVRKAAQEFEGLFLSQMLQPMFSDLGAGEPFGGGPSEEIWRSMLVDEYGKSLARAGGIGLADRVMTEMLRAQEAR
jgi:flagellar protein FlgJ